MGKELDKTNERSFPWRGGRVARGDTWKAVVGAAMSETALNSGGKSWKQLVVERVRELALRGVPWAVEFLADREDGRPGVSVEVSRGRGMLEQLSDEELGRVLEMVRALRGGAEGGG